MQKPSLSYLDFKYASTTKIFEAEEIKGLTPDQIKQGEDTYRLIVEKLEKGEPLEEGLFSGLLLGGASALIGPSIMRAICKVLGIEENGTLGKLLTSKLVLGAVGYTIGR
jgi:hypothetical protein